MFRKLFFYFFSALSALITVAFIVIFIDEKDIRILAFVLMFGAGSLAFFGEARGDKEMVTRVIGGALNLFTNAASRGRSVPPPAESEEQQPSNTEPKK